MCLNELQPTTKIGDLKQMITAKEGIPKENQRLIFNEKQLEDGQTLNDYNIQKYCSFGLTIKRLIILLKKVEILIICYI